MGKELWEKYWTTETIKEAWTKNNVDRSENAEGIARKFHRILKDKLNFGIEEIGWFKAVTKGNQQYYVFNREADVPGLINELFEIFSSPKRVLFLRKNEKRVEEILKDILPIYEEEIELSPAEEIKDCLTMLHRMSNFNIFCNEEFNDATNMLKMLDEINNFISDKKKEIDINEESKIIGVNEFKLKDEHSEQEIYDNYWRKRHIISERVKKFYASEKSKKFLTDIISDVIKESDDFQGSYRLIYLWYKKWLDSTKHVIWLRHAEDFYNMYELFEVHKKFGNNKIKSFDSRKCLEKVKWSSSDIVNEYEHLYFRIHISILYEHITCNLINLEKLKETIPDKKIRDENRCVQESIKLIEDLYAKGFNKLSTADCLQMREWALKELIEMFKEDDERTQEQDDTDKTPEIDSEQEGICEKENLGEIVYNIRHYKDIDKNAMINKYTSSQVERKKDRDKDEMKTDLEYIYSCKSNEENNILIYRPYREFMNIELNKSEKLE